MDAVKKSKAKNKRGAMLDLKRKKLLEKQFFCMSILFLSKLDEITKNRNWLIDFYVSDSKH